MAVPSPTATALPCPAAPIAVLATSLPPYCEYCASAGCAGHSSTAESRAGASSRGIANGEAAGRAIAVGATALNAFVMILLHALQPTGAHASDPIDLGDD